jgi:hypothetical protein
LERSSTLATLEALMREALLFDMTGAWRKMVIP